ncbi:hypothetical protein [Geopsychrobacter electrodiphilus]|uniref:hypothetical protein n=1 Tax=Geopsychrobacter electrodiphilus TaxID=225196 RepID=UPI000A014C74
MPWAITEADSSLNHPAVYQNYNGTVDIGLMQINSAWADQLGKIRNYLDGPCTHVMASGYCARPTATPREP